QNVPTDEREAQARQYLATEAHRAFDLSQGPLVRAHLLCLAEDEYILLIVMHHTISDGWSLVLLFQELEAFYREFAGGAEAALLPLPVQYADYASWQRQTMQGKVLEQELSYWKGKLAGAPPVLDLSCDHIETGDSAHDAARHEVLIPKLLADQ